MPTRKRILFLAPYYGGSHRAFADGWQRRSRHDIRILSLPARKWKWRMQTAAWVFAQEFQRLSEPPPDLVFATDMVNLSEFLGLTRRRLGRVPSVLYFHENQYSYPEQVAGRSDFSWGNVNLSAALAADRLVFNSAFHRADFFENVRRGVRRMPDGRLDFATLDAMEANTEVIAPGVDFEYLDSHEPTEPASDGPPLVLWNHRWEHDKGPEAFFEALDEVRRAAVPFRLAVCGERFDNEPPCFEEARRRFAGETEVFGFLPDRADYARLLWRSATVVSTALQEFLGLAVVEAVWCGCHPLLPRRLNYPYLLPEPLHAAHLYDSDADLGARLIEVLRAPEALRREARPDYLRPCGWPEVSDQLDHLVDELAGALPA